MKADKAEKCEMPRVLGYGYETDTTPDRMESSTSQREEGMASCKEAEIMLLSSYLRSRNTRTLQAQIAFHQTLCHRSLSQLKPRFLYVRFVSPKDPAIFVCGSRTESRSFALATNQIASGILTERQTD
ncbi:hypothetical protein QTJ16_002110 [Diplocarpon rosae]|uniref:Uncharacterized protein n=1 Tax=Diplocarpon rosae TaxID=946125 RepID=A0AAD9T4S7_9HELO|nr:hypothetical protein QTJ16_002110 [Diplocarpon rosae]